MSTSPKPPFLDFDEILAHADHHGTLARNLKGFEPRTQQQLMMRDVTDAYNKQAVALIEAGTGTGKSIAYLLPAILWAHHHKERTLLSTHTITLQEQLIDKDIPQLINALGLDIKAVLVKGMGNYACLRKIDESHNDTLLMDSQECAEFTRIEAWAESTKDGSKASLAFVPTHAGWERVAAESDTCAGTQCPRYMDCFFFKARRKAEDAQLLIANHHLLFADLALRADTENYDEPAILPSYKHIVIDEAHHIEDVATEFFGSRTSKIAVLRLLKRLMADKQNKGLGKLPLLRDKLQQCFQKNFENEISSLLSRINFDLQSSNRDLLDNTKELFDLLTDFISDEQVDSKDNSQPENKLRLDVAQYQTTFWQKKVVSASKQLNGSAKRFIQALAAIEEDCKELKIDRFQEQSKLLRSDISAFSSRLAEHTSLIEQMTLNPIPEDRVRWVEMNRLNVGSNVSLVSAPLNIAKQLSEGLFNKFKGVILCSATLTSAHQFDFVRNRLGITEQNLPNKVITTSIYDAPFDYGKQSLLAVPTDLPDPSHSNFTAAAAQQIWHAIEISRGSTFVLFTSYGMMQKCHELMTDRLKNNRYNLFKQGDANRQHLLKRFKETPRSVLFGTDSFWEGVDVAGEALRCVVIVKLPFRVPSEPIIKARTEAIIERGGDPFYEYTLPNAIVKFKQGFGRLIRNRRDRGCIICLDTRLITKKYGKLFLSSLPGCQLFTAPSAEVEREMRDFYRRTHHLIIQ